MNTTHRRRLAVAIPGALAAGGLAGAGVAFHWYRPAVGVALAILIGLSVGAVVAQTVRDVKRAGTK